MQCGQPITCIGLDQPCVLDQDCCTNECSESSFCSCVPLGQACAESSDCCEAQCNGGVCGELQCDPPGTNCTSGAPCCSGRCEDVTFGAGALQCCGPVGCGHDICEMGGALDAANCASECITTICAADPFCCCVDWDQACVNRVLSDCMMVCPPVP